MEKEIEIARTYMKEINAFEAKVLGIKELIIGRINYDCNRSITYLHFKEKIIVKEIKKIVIRLNEIRVSDRIVDTIKRLIFMNVSYECYVPYEPYLD